MGIEVVQEKYIDEDGFERRRYFLRNHGELLATLTEDEAFEVMDQIERYRRVS
jgi:hypothetical protein